jgi:hypothetical protein
MLHLDQARLDVSGLGRFLAEADASCHLLRPAHARMATGPVSHPRVRLGLQRAQVSDQRRGQVLPGAPQGRLCILDDLPVQAQVQGLVGQQGDDVSAKPRSPEALAMRRA